MIKLLKPTFSVNYDGIYYFESPALLLAKCVSISGVYCSLRMVFNIGLPKTSVLFPRICLKKLKRKSDHGSYAYCKY